MAYKNSEIAKVAKQLKLKLTKLDDKRAIWREPALTALFERLKTLPPKQRPAFGREVNLLKAELQKMLTEFELPTADFESIDVSAPMDVNAPKPPLLPTEQGSKHPVMAELELILDIFSRMGFDAVESREIDDDYHMFTSLNFPANHPARADYDTFITTEGLIAPAHTSTMQNRLLKAGREKLKTGQPIAVVIPGRVFRNEDIDATHEHTFYQLEGIYVDKGINAGHLVATLKTFLEDYFGKSVNLRFQPFYFPFTEPSLELILSCPFCDGAGCGVCKQSGWIELLGCGMIHPNVLTEAGIDAKTYTGFAWGMGIERLVMMKYNIEDIRHFESANLRFLRQFK